MVDRAATEFAEVDHMIATAERLYGRYRWGRYDVLVMPNLYGDILSDLAAGLVGVAREERHVVSGEHAREPRCIRLRATPRARAPG